MPQNLPKRKNIRLKEYDYSKSGYYFITICTYNKKCILSKIKNERNIIKLPDNVGVALQGDPIVNINLSKEGKIVKKHIENCNKIKNIRIDKFVIMPNHIHFIIEITKMEKNGAPKTAPPTMPKIINSFKSIVTKELGYPIWQRNYYEHIIRDETEYLIIKQYIINNPYNWENDKYY